MSCLSHWVWSQPLLWWFLAGWIVVLCLVVLFGLGSVLGADRWAGRHSTADKRRG